MSKFLTTLFLTIATLLSGLVLATPTVNVSAALNDPLRCSFPGRYIERSQADAPCVSCPVDFYCPTQIRNGSDGKPSQFSPEKPGKNGQTNSEVVPCPSGTTTLGFTYHPYKLSLLTKDEDGFKVGTLGTDPSNCRTPDFKCPASTPRLVNLDGKSSCYLACPSAQVEVIKDGMQSCILECRKDETSVNGKCYEACKDGSTLTIINGVVNCNDKCLASSIRGQIVGPKGNCECPVGTQIIIDSGSYSSGRCGVVIISSSSSSVTPPPVSSSSTVTPPAACIISGQTRVNGTCVCPNPTYAVVAANGSKSCGTCPADNFITQVGVEATGEITYKCNAPVVKSSSSSSVTPPTAACAIPGQIRSFGTCACPLPNYAIVATNGTKSCGTCPADNFITQVGVEATGEITYKCNAPEPVKPTNNGGGGSDFWTYAGIAVGLYGLYDGFTCGGLFTFVSCDSPKAAVAAPVKPTYNEINGPIQDCYFYSNCQTNPIDVTPESIITYQCQKGQITDYDVNGNTICINPSKKPGGDCTTNCPTENPFSFNYYEDDTQTAFYPQDNGYGYLASNDFYDSSYQFSNYQDNTQLSTTPFDNSFGSTFESAYTPQDSFYSFVSPSVDNQFANFETPVAFNSGYDYQSTNYETASIFGNSDYYEYAV